MKLDTKTFGIRHQTLIVVMGIINLPDVIRDFEAKPDTNGGHSFLFDENKIWADDKFKEYRCFNILDFYAN